MPATHAPIPASQVQTQVHVPKAPPNSGPAKSVLAAGADEPVAPRTSRELIN